MAGVCDVAHPESLAGANDPLLARAFCDKRREGDRRRLDVAAESIAASIRAWRFSAIGSGDFARPGDAHLPGLGDESQGTRKRELRSRVDGAILPGRRELFGKG